MGGGFFGFIWATDFDLLWVADEIHIVARTLCVSLKLAMNFGTLSS